MYLSISYMNNTPFGVLLLVYKPTTPEGHIRVHRGGLVNQHTGVANKVFIDSCYRCLC